MVVTDRGIAASGILSKLEPGLKRADRLRHLRRDRTKPGGGGGRASGGAGPYCGRRRGARSRRWKPIDAGKMVAVLARFAGAVRDYEGINTVTEPTLPLVAIPTTVGTGSEVTRGAVITDTSRNAKMVCVSPHVFPRVAILDPDLLENLPPHITAATGMDSLTQAIEVRLAWGESDLRRAQPRGAPLDRREPAARGRSQ